MKHTVEVFASVGNEPVRTIGTAECESTDRLVALIAIFLTKFADPDDGPQMVTIHVSSVP